MLFRSVCLCEIVSTNYQSSCIPKHSYMHNHASYVFMHSIKLSCYSYASVFSIPMLISIKINLVNFQIFSVNNKCLLSCQFQSSTVLSTFLSNSSSCSYVNQIQVFSEYNLFLLSVKRPVRIQEQLVPILLVYAERQVHIQEQLVLPFSCRPSNQFASKNSLCFLLFLSAK